MTLQEPRDTSRASRLTHESNAVGVSSECMDVKADPIESYFLVKETKVALTHWNFIGVRTKREPKDIGAIIDRDNYYVLVFCKACLLNRDSHNGFKNELFRREHEPRHKMERMPCPMIKL